MKSIYQIGIEILSAYVNQLDNGHYLYLDVGHYVHAWEPELIGKEMDEFLMRIEPK